MQSNGPDIQERLKLLKQAGLTPAELSQLLKVSRVTASLWLNGHARPHHLLEERVERLLDVVEEAMAARELPLSIDIPRRERRVHLRRIIGSRLA